MLTPKERQVLDSQREIDWLERQIQQYEQDLVPGEAIDHDGSSQLDDLRTNMGVLAQYNLTKERITRSIDASHFVLENLYASESPLQEKINERDELVVAVLRLVERVRKTKEELALTQKEVIEHHKTNRQMTMDIEKLKAQDLPRQRDNASIASSHDPQPLADVVRDLQDRIEITRNVLLGLILESNIDWASDEHWLATMHHIGNELED